MRMFGWIFLGVGVVLAAISINAVLDPNTIYEGWERFSKDPWVFGIRLGGLVAIAGVVLLVLAPRVVSARTRIAVGRLIAVMVIGFVGFALFAPVASTRMCADGLNVGFCETQNWSTITGLTINGEEYNTLALISAFGFAAAAVAFLAWRSRRDGKGMADSPV